MAVESIKILQSSQSNDNYNVTINGMHILNNNIPSNRVRRNNKHYVGAKQDLTIFSNKLYNDKEIAEILFYLLASIIAYAVKIVLP